LFSFFHKAHVELMTELMTLTFLGYPGIPWDTLGWHQPSPTMKHQGAAGVTSIAGWFISWKIHLKMNDNWG
jgi:hypothetical protein